MRSTNVRWKPIWRWRCCLDAQAVLRPDLGLLAMSATLDGARLSAIMNAPHCGKRRAHAIRWTSAMRRAI